jgi:single-strand DNA-binding protein
MSMMNNLVMLSGNVGGTPDVTYHPGGSVVVNFNLASKDGYKDRTTGQWVDKTTWHSIEAWGEVAKRIEKYVDKGTNLSVCGKLQVESWEKDGKRNYRHFVLVNEFRVNSGGKKREDEISSM